jgi:hypothetical protein
MKKYFIAFFLIIVIGTRLNAQTSVQSYTHMYDSLLKYSPSGLLLDRSPHALMLVKPSLIQLNSKV